MTRSTYVYMLDVKYPEGSEDPDWMPEVFEDEETTRVFTDHLGRDQFTNSGWTWRGWPRERKYLTRGPAQRRAFFLRLFGCEVTILRSAPVSWDVPAPPGQKELSARRVTNAVGRLKQSLENIDGL